MSCDENVTGVINLAEKTSISFGACPNDDNLNTPSQKKTEPC